MKSLNPKAVGLVLDKLVEKLEIATEEVENLSRLNWDSIRECKSGIKSARKAVDSFTEAISNQKLACEDIKFFSNLIAGRIHGTADPFAEGPANKCQTEGPNSHRGSAATPWGMLKQFDEMYKNREMKIEQRIDRKVQEATIQSIRKRTEHQTMHLPPFASTGGETRIFALDSTTEAYMPSILNYLSEGARISTASPESQNIKKEVLKEILQTGQNILQITEAQLEADATKAGKLKSEVAKEIFQLQKIQDEVSSKMTTIQQALDNLELKCNPQHLTRLELYNRMNELSSVKPKLVKKNRKFEISDDESVEVPRLEQRKHLSDESLSEFLHRNYENFLIKFAQRMQEMKERADIKVSDFRSSSPGLKDKLQNLQPIDKEAHVLQATATLKYRRQESIKKVKEINDRQSLLTKIKSRGNTNEKMYEEWKNSKKTDPILSTVKSKIDNGRNPGSSQEPRSLSVKLSRKPTLQKPASKLVKSGKKETLIEPKPKKLAPVVTPKKIEHKVPINERSPVKPKTLTDLKNSSSKKTSPLKSAKKPDSTQYSSNKKQTQVEPSKIASPRKIPQSPVKKVAQTMEKLLPDELLEEKAIIVETPSPKEEPPRSPSIEVPKEAAPKPEPLDNTPILRTSIRPSRQATQYELKRTLTSIVNTDETADNIMQLISAAILDEIFDAPEPIEPPDHDVVAAENPVQPLNIRVPPLPRPDRPAQLCDRPATLELIDNFPELEADNKPPTVDEGSKADEDLMFDDDSVDANNVANIDVQVMSPTKTAERFDHSMSLDANESIEQKNRLNPPDPKVVSKSRRMSQFRPAGIDLAGHLQEAGEEEGLEDLLAFDEDSADPNAF